MSIRRLSAILQASAAYTASHPRVVTSHPIARVRHGGFGSPEYAAWGAMIQRCTNPKHPRWKYYGARGISICERWRNSFSAFLDDMGTRPSADHSLDRINNDGNYEPNNCRWATWVEQRANRRPRGMAM